MEWISVKDRFPDKYKDVLVCTKNGMLTAIHYFTDRKEWQGHGLPFRTFGVTYWIPIPEPPTKSQKQ